MGGADAQDVLCLKINKADVKSAGVRAEGNPLSMRFTRACYVVQRDVSKALS